MMIALLAEHALMSVLLKQYQKVIFIKSILMYAPIVVHAQMSARLRRYILNRIINQKLRAVPSGTAFFNTDCTLLSPV